MSECLFYRSVLLLLCLCNSRIFHQYKSHWYVCICAFLLYFEGAKRGFQQVLGEMGSGVSGLAEPGWLGRRCTPHPLPKGYRRTACWEGKTKQTPENTDCTQAVLLICGERLDPAGLWSS